MRRQIKTKRDKNENLNETKLQDELIILKAKEMEPVTKIELVPFPNSEETSAEIKAPMEAIAELELLPTLTKDEVPIGMELPSTVSMEDSFQPPPIHNKKNLKDVPLAVPEPYKPDIEKIKAEEIQIKDIAQNTKKIEISKNKNAERNATVEDLTNNKLAVNLVANGKTVNATDKEETLIVPKIKKEEQEVISNHIERHEKKKNDIIETKREEIIVENEKTDEVLPVTEIEENEFVKEIVEKSKEIPQLNETKMTDIKETTPHMEIISTEDEIVEVPPVPEMVEVEQEKTILATNMKEVKEIIPEAISATTDVIEVEKFEPNKFPTVDVEKVTNAVEEKITNAVEEKIKIEEPTPIFDVKEEPLLVDTVMEEKIEIEEPVIMKEEIKTAESQLITDITEKEQIEVTELSPIEDIEKKKEIEVVALPPILDMEKKEEKIEAAESPPVLDITKKEKIEVTEIEDMEKKEEIEAVALPSITDIAKEEKIEAERLPPMANMIEKEKIKAEELLSLADAVTEEKVEIIQPVPTSPTIEREMEEELEAAEESVLKVEIKKEKDEEIEEEEVTMPDEVTSFIELPKIKKEEEMPPVEKKKIPTEVPPSKKPTLKNKEEVEEKKPEVVQIELKIPIAEIKPTEMEMPTIPLDPQLVAQPYLIIAKLKEKELLQIIPAKQPCTGCYCLVSKCPL